MPFQSRSRLFYSGPFSSLIDELLDLIITEPCPFSDNLLLIDIRTDKRKVVSHTKKLQKYGAADIAQDCSSPPQHGLHEDVQSIQKA